METQFFEPKNTIWGSFTQPICGDVGCLANHLEKNAAYCFWWYLIQTEDWRHKMQPRKKTWGLPTWLEKPPLFSTYFHWWINRCTLVSFRKKFQFHPKFDNCSGPLGMKNKHPLPGGWATQGKISQVVLLAHYNRTKENKKNMNKILILILQCSSNDDDNDNNSNNISILTNNNNNSK